MVGNHQTSRSSSRCFQPNFLFNFSLWAWWRREMVGQRWVFFKEISPQNFGEPFKFNLPLKFFLTEMSLLYVFGRFFWTDEPKTISWTTEEWPYVSFFFRKFSLNTTSRRKWWTFYAYDSERKYNLETWHGACFHLDSMSNHLPNLQSLGSSRLFSGYFVISNDFQERTRFHLSNHWDYLGVFMLKLLFGWTPGRPFFLPNFRCLSGHHRLF